MLNVSVSKAKNYFFENGEIVRIVNNKKHKSLGFFVLSCYEEEFNLFLKELEKKRKKRLLEKISKAQKLDPVEDIVDDIR